MALALIVAACGPVAPRERDDTVIEATPALVASALTLADCPPGSNIIQGNGQNNTINGTPGPDCIFGGGGNDTINGGGGDDVIDGGSGNDLISGGDGDDLIDGGSNEDAIFGDAGNDTLLGGNGSDAIDGGEGNDFIDGGNGSDLLLGGDGHDEILGGDNGADVIFAGPGDDFVDSGNGPDFVDCGEGLDTGDAGDNCEESTAVRIESAVEGPRAMLVDVVAVLGPSALELWRVENGRAAFTGASRAVLHPGRFLLQDPAPRDGARYVVVDRGPDGVDGVYPATKDPDAHRLRAIVAKALNAQRLPLRPRLPRPLGDRPRPAPAVADPFLPPARDDDVFLVDLGEREGVVVLPALVDDRRVAELWLDGVRRPAFACAEALACVLVPPRDGDAHEGRRAGLLGFGAPRALGRGFPGRAHEDAPALASRRAVPRPQLVIDWATPAERMMHVGFIWHDWVPSLSLVAPARPGDGPIRSVSLDLVAWRGDATLTHEVLLSSTSLAPTALSFTGVRGTLTAALSRLEGASDDLTLTMSPLATAIDEALLVTGARVERERAVALVHGALAAHVVAEGRLALGEDAVVLVDDPAGGRPSGVLLDGDAAWGLRAGDVVAALSTQALAARAPLDVTRVPSPRRALGADLVVVDGAAPSRHADAADALAPWLAARGDEVVRAAVVSHAALAAAVGGEHALRSFVAALAAARPAHRTMFVVIAGDAASLAGADDALFVPAPIISDGQVLTMSDARLATDDDGAWLPGVVVSRLPVADLPQLDSLARQLADAARDEAALPRDALFFTDPSQGFARTATLMSTRLGDAGWQPEVLDGEALGAAAVAPAVATSVRAGDVLVYVGHGSPTKLANAVGAAAFDGDGARASTLVGLTCMAGDAALPNASQLAASLFRRSAGGVRTALLGGGFLDVGTHDRVAEALADALVGVDGGFGEVWLSTRDAAVASGAAVDAIDAYALFGDPFARRGSAP